MRQLLQPGPIDPVRIESVAGYGQELSFQLRPDCSLGAAVATPPSLAGFGGAVARLRGGRLSPFTYVLPARSPSAAHAAYYSEPFRLESVQLETADVTVGRRDGAPFIHCHALWLEPDGTRRVGHVVPDRSIVAAPIAAQAFGWRDIGLGVEHDPETNFALFRPFAPDDQVAANGAMARVRPNEDITLALEAVCREHGFRAATVRGGVGSLIGAAFTDGRVVADLATEVLVLEGEVAPDADGEPRARLEVALVDTRGRLHQGQLVRGRNPVCITFELAIAAPDGARLASRPALLSGPNK